MIIIKAGIIKVSENFLLIGLFISLDIAESAIDLFTIRWQTVATTHLVKSIR